jgi:D-alanyl-lipoteichoic acid acyltransferase DltB (MBOAT superfamily)
MHLLAASCYFYMAFVPVYIFILAVTIVVDYIAGIYIEGASGKKRKAILVVSIISNVGFLAFFKYFNFLNDNLSLLLGKFGFHNHIPALEILLPIGLSFHTFQAMSYTIEVYRGNQKAEKHFGIYALYVMFYPQLVAGPIERPQNMLHQFREKHSFDYHRVVDGLRLMLWGMFKKVVIADRLAVYVNEVYRHPQTYHGFTILTACYFFAIQIYCDFSGYSDIAMGSAKVMGFDLMQNFRVPYFASSIREFWSRWHISLSTWFRDYVYFPLGGNRVKEWRWFFNLLIVFMISGLWHGAKWTFVIWGALHGILLIAGILINRIQPVRKMLSTGWGKIIATITTFHLVVLGWIFFRADSLHDARLILVGLFRFSGSAFTINLGYGKEFLDHIELLLSFGLIALLLMVNWVEQRTPVNLAVQKLKPVQRWMIYYSCVMLIIFLGNYSSRMDFIYFQF